MSERRRKRTRREASDGAKTSAKTKSSATAAGGGGVNVVPIDDDPAVLAQDPVYRIMHRLPRSDILEVIKCKFGPAECARALAYFDRSFMKNPLRRLRLQIGCSGAGGLASFFPRLAHHSRTLRHVDLSRNDLSSEDAVALCASLGLATASAANDDVCSGDSPPAAAAPTTSSSSFLPALEVLDVSYNRRLGNTGALHIMKCLQHCRGVRAVILKCVGIDDAGAAPLAEYLRRRPPVECPEPTHLIDDAPGRAGDGTRNSTNFFVNLNENRIGAVGTVQLGRNLPSFVSLTLAKQYCAPRQEERRRQ